MILETQKREIRRGDCDSLPMRRSNREGEVVVLIVVVIFNLLTIILVDLSDYELVFLDWNDEIEADGWKNVRVS